MKFIYFGFSVLFLFHMPLSLIVSDFLSMIKHCNRKQNLFFLCAPKEEKRKKNFDDEIDDKQKCR